MRRALRYAFWEAFIFALPLLPLGFSPIASGMAGVIAFSAVLGGLLVIRGLNRRFRLTNPVLLFVGGVLGLAFGVLAAVTFSVTMEVHPIVTIPLGAVLGGILGLFNTACWRDEHLL